VPDHLPIATVENNIAELVECFFIRQHTSFLISEKHPRNARARFRPVTGIQPSSPLCLARVSESFPIDQAAKYAQYPGTVQPVSPGSKIQDQG